MYGHEYGYRRVYVYACVYTYVIIRAADSVTDSFNNVLHACVIQYMLYVDAANVCVYGGL
jgi:hypothetical protein